MKETTNLSETSFILKAIKVSSWYIYIAPSEKKTTAKQNIKTSNFCWEFDDCGLMITSIPH